MDRALIIDVGLEGRELTLRHEVEPSTPLGLASFITLAAISEVRIRSFDG